MGNEVVRMAEVPRTLPEVLHSNVNVSPSGSEEWLPSRVTCDWHSAVWSGPATAIGDWLPEGRSITNHCENPPKAPKPTIRPASLMYCALLSSHPEFWGRTVFRSIIVPFDQRNACGVPLVVAESPTTCPWLLTATAEL